MSRINTGRLGGRIRVRIMRPWRGYPVGAVIQPPGAMRQILLQAKDQLGHKVAEEVVEDEALPENTVGPDVAGPDDELGVAVEDEDVGEDGEQETKRKRGRPRKGETK